MTDKCREEFEAWYKSSKLIDGFGRDWVTQMLSTYEAKSESYCQPCINQLWQTWQASAEKSAAKIAELEERIEGLEYDLLDERDC